MSPQTFILFGTSGSGKGTQAKLLIDLLKQKDVEREVLYIETGRRFREFVRETSPSASEAKRIMEEGGLLPEFLPIWIWTEYMIRHVSGNEHMVLDGLARRIHEAPILDSAMKFYKRESPTVLLINVSRDWAKERLVNREGERQDDKDSGVERRLNWYQENVLPAIEFFKNNPYYKFIEINGEQSVEEVHKEILEKINLTL